MAPQGDCGDLSPQNPENRQIKNYVKIPPLLSDFSELAPPLSVHAIPVYMTSLTGSSRKIQPKFNRNSNAFVRRSEVSSVWKRHLSSYCIRGGGKLICPLQRGFRCKKVSVNGGSIAHTKSAKACLTNVRSCD